MATKLVIGLGNIGPEYQMTRHNAGFIIVDNFAAQQGWKWQEKPKFKAIVAEGLLDTQKVILAKPVTYMNLSGEAVRALKDFYKIENHDILVIHDELALPFGTVRTRLGGSDAGNNGIRSVIAHIGSDFARLRIGISNEQRVHMDAADFVLARFSTTEKSDLLPLQEKASQLIDDFARGQFSGTTHQLPTKE